MKKYIWGFLLFLIASIINLTIFTISYNLLATPYLDEPQRVENASNILMVVFPAYILSALIIVSISYFFGKKNE